MNSILFARTLEIPKENVESFNRIIRSIWKNCSWCLIWNHFRGKNVKVIQRKIWDPLETIPEKSSWEKLDIFLRMVRILSCVTFKSTGGIFEVVERITQGILWYFSEKFPGNILQSSFEEFRMAFFEVVMGRLFFFLIFFREYFGVFQWWLPDEILKFSSKYLTVLLRIIWNTLPWSRYGKA